MNSTDKLRATLKRIAQKLEPALVARDAAALSGDVRRRKAAQQRIADYLDRLDATETQRSFAAPLHELQNAGRVKFGGVAQALNAEAVAALGKVISDPYKAALADAKTPLPYLKPWMLNEEQAAAAAALVLEGHARGMGWKQMGRLLREEFPQLGRPTQTDFLRGTVIEKQGVRVPVERYADMLARTTSVWANNQGVLARCEEMEVETVIVPVAPGTIDFCLELEGKVFALTPAAAEKWNVPLLAATPNGGPPWHPNCRHSIAPYTPLQKDGPLPKPDEKFLTRHEGVSRSDQVSGAQQAFKSRLESDPLRYAAQIAESAARRGFGSRTVRLQGRDKNLAGQQIPGIVGQREMFGPAKSTALAEDVHLAKRMADSGIKGRVEFRQRITDTLRAGAASAADQVASHDGRLIYHDPASRWVAIVEAKSGLVVTAYPLGKEMWTDYAKEYGQ